MQSVQGSHTELGGLVLCALNLVLGHSSLVNLGEGQSELAFLRRGPRFLVFARGVQCLSPFARSEGERRPLVSRCSDGLGAFRQL